MSIPVQILVKPELHSNISTVKGVKAYRQPLGFLSIIFLHVHWLR